MNKKTKMRLYSIILSFLMLVSICPTNVYAWDEEIDCEFCGAFCGDSYICDGGAHCSEESGRDCYQENHCQHCGECKSNASEWCDDCHMCVECAMLNECHCVDCGVCGVDEQLCEECGRCYSNCGGECSEGKSHLCFECHLDYGYACEKCGLCYLEDESIKCQICSTCHECSDEWCDACNMCVECAADNGCHCVSCSACQVDNELCAECWQCYDCAGECSEGTDHVCLECHLSLDYACPGCGLCYVEDETLKCLICGYCAACETEWCADCHMGIECAMDNGCHCIECGVCQVESKLCENCWRCYDCGGTCSEGDDHYCLECHIENGEACPACEYCFIDRYETSCEGCGVCFDCCTDWCDMCNMCYECAIKEGYHCQSCEECLETVDDYCEGCFICSDCSSGICESCGECADCVEICPNCEGYCNECADVCGDCGSCEYCTDMNYCDICNEYYCYSCRFTCSGCGSCESCVNVCPSCENYCSECAAICDECGECEFCVSLCETCEEYCSDCYDKCPNCETAIAQKIDVVELTVNAPIEGNTPSYTVGCASEAYYAIGGSSNYTDYRQWMESVDGVNYTVMSTGDTFKEGYYYKFYADISAGSGYTFLVYDDGISIQPNVLATVNGSNAKVHKMFEQEPSKYITVEYNFGACEDNVIDSIDVINVDKPVAGNTPDYVASTVGIGYKIADSNYDNYHVNGITWYDSTEEEYGLVMYKDSIFKAGHKYTVVIKVVTDSGYEFYTDKYGEVLAKCSVNNNPAEFGVTASGYQWEQKIVYSFTCEKGVVTEMEITNLSTPIAGETIDTLITVDEPDCYMPDPNYGFGGVYWYDSEGNLLEEDYKFVEGETYQVELKIVPVSYNGLKVCTFDSNLKVTANGATPSQIYAMSDKVYVYFDFLCVAKENDELTAAIKADNNVTKVNVGEEVIYRGLATGGTGSYTYKFALLDVKTNQWTILSDFSKQSEFVYKAVKAGTYQFAMTIKDSAGTVLSAKRADLVVEDVKPLAGTLKVNNSTDKITVAAGSNLTLNASATGGSGVYTYKYALLNTKTGAWNVFKNFTAVDEQAYIIKTAGTYQFACTVKDNKGETVSANRVTVVVEEAKTLSATLKVNNSVDKITVKSGTDLTLTTTAAGGSGNYTYKYAMLNLKTGVWSILKDFNASNTYVLSKVGAGSYQFAATVKDNVGKTVAAERVTVNVENSGEALKGTLKVNGSADKLTVSVGTDLTLTPEANGGDGNYTYKYAMLNTKTNVWTVFKDFSEAKEYIHRTRAEGTYEFACTVKDGSGKTVATNRVTVVVEKEPEPLSGTLTVNGSTDKLTVAKGTKITLNVNATGGSGSYTYKFAVLNVDNGKWSVLKDFGSEATYTYALNYSGTKEFAVTIKDSKGATVATNRLVIVVK